MKQNSKTVLRKYLPVIIGVAAGAIGGYLYYYFVGCVNGTCAITSNPVVSAVYGGIIGGLLGSVFVRGACCACTAGKCKEEDHE